MTSSLLPIFMATTNKNNIKYSLLMVLQCIFWGVGNPVIKLGQSYMPPLYTMAIRFFLALLVFLVAFRRKLPGQVTRSNVLKGLFCGSINGLAFVFNALAVTTTQASIAGFYCGLAVVFAPFLLWICFGVRPSFKVFPALGLAVTGLYLLSGGGSFSFGAGEGFAVLSSLSFAVTLIYTDRYLREVPNEILSVCQMASATVLALVLALCTENWDLSTMNYRGVLVIIYLAVFSSALAYFIQNVSLKHISSSVASFIYCLEAVFGAIASVLLLGETMTLPAMIGAALTLAGTVLAVV